VIDLTSENVIRLEEAAHICQTHFSTIFRWVTKGIPGADGERVRLRAVKCGAKWLSSTEAIAEFCEATTPRIEAAVPPRTAGARRKASERAAKKLQQAGI
jgi:hypothetical protein